MDQKTTPLLRHLCERGPIACPWCDLLLAMAKTAWHPGPALFAAAPELLDIARRCEAMLARQLWREGGPDPEAQLMTDARALIARIGGAA